MNIEEIVRACRDAGASDIHIVAGLPVKYRVDGVIKSLDSEIVSQDMAERYAMELAGEEYDLIRLIGELDLARTFDCGARTRLNIFRQQGSVSCAIRIFSDHIPEIEELSLPPIAGTLPDYRSGIVLVTGETGSGKSTTLASVINRINHTRNAHIITVENPIEYIYKPDKCVINQREIGRDTRSYADALRAILREDPDVILIGEMRDLETIDTALTAAETGHLVFATLHTNSAADSIDRIVNSFSEGRQRQIRMQLSTTLRCVISQQLLPLRSGRGRIVACEVMVVNNAIANLIREGKTPQITNAIATSAQDGGMLMDAALKKLVRDGKVSYDTALSYARDKSAFSAVR